MSRGRQANTVHVIADDLDQAADDLTRDWSVDHRARWAIDSGTPATEALAVEQNDRAPAGMRAALRHARLQAELDAVAAAIPPDPSFELAAVERKLAELRRDRAHLLTGRGRYIGTRAGDTARRLILARQESSDAQRHLAGSDSWWDRRHWRKEATRCADVESAAETAYTASVGPEMNYLDQAISWLEDTRDDLEIARRQRSAWLDEHPEAAHRLRRLNRELKPVPELPEIQTLGHHHAANLRRATNIQPPRRDLGIEPDIGP